MSLQPDVAEAPALIHREKALWDVWHELENRDLARESSNWDWMEVDPSVAAMFMAYLAGRLGRTPEFDMLPITDQSAYSRTSAPSSAIDTAALFDQMRGAVLSGVLPAPRDRIDVRELARFKEANWELLGGFRRYRGFSSVVGSVIRSSVA